LTNEATRTELEEAAPSGYDERIVVHAFGFLNGIDLRPVSTVTEFEFEMWKGGEGPAAVEARYERPGIAGADVGEDQRDMKGLNPAKGESLGLETELEVTFSRRSSQAEVER
jgi:hypothetical protein